MKLNNRRGMRNMQSPEKNYLARVLNMCSMTHQPQNHLGALKVQNLRFQKQTS